MPINLKVTGHGIGPFVASKDDKRAALLLCEAPGELVPNQTVYVRFRPANYSRRNRRVPVVQPFSEFAHVVLNRERLSIVAAVAQSDAELRIDRSKDPTSSTPTRRDRRSLHWLPRTEELAPGHGDLKKSYFTNPLTATPRLLARVDFTQGRLGTTGAETVQVPFVSSKRSVRRAMARDIQLDLTIDANHFVLRSDPFEGPRDPANDLHFEGEGDIEIVIGNEPEEDIHKITPPIHPIDVIGKAAAAEFVFYVSLCEKVPEDPLLPHVAKRPGLQTFCSRPEYNPVESFDATSFFSFKGGALSLTETAERPQTSEATAARELPKWSVLAFIAADNSLRNEAVKDLEEMAKADPSKVSVVAQIDRPDTATERLVLGPTGFEAVSDEVLGNVNSGKLEALQDFLISGKSVRPGDYTAVIALSHGSGMRDFIPRGSSPGGRRSMLPDNFDVTPFMRVERFRAIFKELSLGPDETSNDALDNQELEEAFRGALRQEGPFDIIGFDACLMGLVEIAYQLRLCGRYFVASEEDLAAEGWPYETVLGGFSDDLAPRDAAVGVVKAFADATKTDAGATLSAVDLEAITPLARKLDDLGGALAGTIPEHMDALARAREAARTFADYDYIDLYGFVDALRRILGKEMPAGRQRDGIVEAATETLEAIRRAVLETNADPHKSGAFGLAVYVPNAPVLPEYHKLALSKDAPRWHDFVVEYGEHR